MTKPFLLAILDGLALNPNPKANAFVLAKKPILEKLLLEYPHTTLITFGQRVGLPEGQMGNSEVGHLNIGAGRVVEQELVRINNSYRSGEFKEIPCFVNSCEFIKNNPNNALHIIGLISIGGVHSHQDHALALVKGAIELGVKNIFIHAITDGRDRPQRASMDEVIKFEKQIKSLRSPEVNIKIATIIGRYYAMDRDTRWERTQMAYELFTNAKGQSFSSIEQALTAQHEAGITDEFIKPCLIEQNCEIKDGDAVIFSNFRADRMRQIVESLISKTEHFKRTNLPKPSSIIMATQFDKDYCLPCLFPPLTIKNNLGEVFSKLGKTQLRIAETEKYPHVTYFFNGGREEVFSGEDRIMIPSPRDVATYDLKPEMSALELTSALCERIETNCPDLIVLNFANCDMVGHTGVLDAAIKAVETVDRCLGKVLDALSKQGGSALITADHGNADQMIDYETGQPHTFHTKHPVPLILWGELSENASLRDGGALCDIAPTICELLKIKQPEQMTGISLVY